MTLHIWIGRIEQILFNVEAYACNLKEINYGEMWQCTKSGTTVAQYLYSSFWRLEYAMRGIVANFVMCCRYVMFCHSHISNEYISLSSLELIVLVRGHDVDY